jgi:arabinofuranan 3-O-arabinosyltransferase
VCPEGEVSVSRTTTLRRSAAAPPELETQAPRTRRLPRLSLSLPWGLTLLAFAVAFAQRPGRAFVDTRFDLTADPGLFLQRIVHVWSGTYDLGHVQSGQSVGYLLPMGPWYALGSWLGVPVWVTQRLWLGTLYALAAWGAVRLLDALYDRRRGVAHAIAGFVFAFNPYVATFTDRASVVLLAYAALPWLLLAVHRGAGEPRRWRWPAFVGLLVAVSGGGTNATLVAMVVPAGLGLLAYEVWALRRPLRAALAFTWRAAACVLVGSLWWLIPVALAAPYGRDFLSFTEHPEAIWMTNSMSESLRLLGYWVLYVKVGFDGAVPLFDWAGPYLFAVPVILATLALPLLALGGLRWTGRWRYARCW